MSEERPWKSGMLKVNSCVLSGLPQGTGVYGREDVWRLHWPKLRVKDKRLFLRAIQIKDKAKGYNPSLTDRPPSPRALLP